MAVGGVVLVWQWATCEADYALFHELFTGAHKEEVFLSDLEHQLNCELDEDKEVDAVWVRRGAFL